jgi:hypothetical protein
MTPVPNGNLSSAAPVTILKVPSVAIVTSNSFKKVKFVSRLPVVSLIVLILSTGKR